MTNLLVYFYDELNINDSLHEEGSDSEELSAPEKIPTTVRNTMEELAYRTAVWYDPKGVPIMHYLMTTNGIQVRKIKDEDCERNNKVDPMPVSGQEPRLLG